jgi:hypothetical protein
MRVGETGLDSKKKCLYWRGHDIHLLPFRLPFSLPVKPAASLFRRTVLARWYYGVASAILSFSPSFSPSFLPHPVTCLPASCTSQHPSYLQLRCICKSSKLPSQTSLQAGIRNIHRYTYAVRDTCHAVQPPARPVN